MHHGVAIDDSALVAAAALSDRYINERFLPDKAIDLIDEAAAKLKMDATSRPQELDEVSRRLLQVRGRGAARRVAAKRARVHKGRRGLLVTEVAGELRRRHKVGTRHHDARPLGITPRHHGARRPVLGRGGARAPLITTPLRLGIGLAGRGDNERVERPRRGRGVGGGRRMRV